MRISDWSSDVCSSDLVASLVGFFGLNSKRGASTCSMSKLAAIAFKVSLTASVTAASAASGSAIRLVKRARALPGASRVARPLRSEEHTSELQPLMRISYAVFCSKKKTDKKNTQRETH